MECRTGRVGSAGEEDEGMMVVAKAVDRAKGVAEVPKVIAEVVDSVTKRDSTSWNRRQGAQERSRSTRASCRNQSRKVIGESNEKSAG